MQPVKVKAVILKSKTAMKTINREAVRKVMLAAQGLHSPPVTSLGKADIMSAIRRMGYLQIDTIQAVRRSQYLVLWSRLGDYKPVWLDELHQERQLFEYYAHSLCYLPMEDYPIFRGMILHDDRTGNGWHEWADAHPEVLDHVRSVIKEKGAVCSSDFNTATVSTGWGDVKQEKLALSRLFSAGELMVSHRVKFRRYYNFQARVLPEWKDSEALDLKAARKELILQAVKALGVAREDWIASYYYLPKTGLTELLMGLVSAGRLHQVRVKEWDVPAYVHPQQMSTVESAARELVQPTHTTFLSPFDPLISDRDRALALFNFDYKMESYTPAKDRKYGYFCLPILHNGRLIGRLDPKAHRKEAQMQIKNIYLEPCVEINDELTVALKETLKKFTAWHGMASYEITASDPPGLQEALE